MTTPGYYQDPTINGDTIVFCCEDDLWTVPVTGGIARRLTANPGSTYTPALSPDGNLLAFAGLDEGNPEVYVMPAAGGPATRLTYLGTSLYIVGWHPDDNTIIFASNAHQPFNRMFQLYSVPTTGGSPTPLPTGLARSISYGPKKKGKRGMVIGRNVVDISHWKRYRGGRTGDLWIDRTGNGKWRRLVKLDGNTAMPQWIGKRIYFISDHEGIGNLYSCLPTGKDLQRHTHHTDYYVRWPTTDGQRIIYHAGADLYLYDIATSTSTRIDIAFHSPQVGRKRKFIDPERYLQDYNLDATGAAITMTVRGKSFTMANWEGAVIQHGQLQDVRYRLARWLYDGEHIILLSDATGEERLEMHEVDTHKMVKRLDGLDIGRPTDLYPSPFENKIALTNQRNELILVDLDSETMQTFDHSPYASIQGVDWSPDGRWLAYSIYITQELACIRLCNLETGEKHDATQPVLRDVRPSFDPEGRYLYFISYREFDPVRDHLQFHYNFPEGSRPYLVMLQDEGPPPFTPLPYAPGDKPPQRDSPFKPPPPPPEEEPETEKETGGDNGEAGEDTSDTSQPTTSESERPAEDTTAGGESSDVSPDEAKKPESPLPPPLHIDLEGMTSRIIPFPVAVRRYGQIQGMVGKVLYTSYPVSSALKPRWRPGSVPGGSGTLRIFNLEDLSRDILATGITDFHLSMNKKVMIYRAGRRLRVLKAGENPPNGGHLGRKSGWIDLNRIRTSIDPTAEWRQMYREAWRLQRDNFWTDDMSGVDWQAIYTRYLPLLDRISTRREFSDLLWEMQGELGTSHAYESGGDYTPYSPQYTQGFLGAEFEYDLETESYRITHIIQGDVWDEEASSPFARGGIGIRVGDRLLAINGRPLTRDLTPQMMLVNQANNEIFISVIDEEEESTPAAEPDADTPPDGSDSQKTEDSPTSESDTAENTGDGETDDDEAPGDPEDGNDSEDTTELPLEPRTIWVTPLHSERPARYREWVEANRQHVHTTTEDRVGYVHIPDMGPAGYAEFHRSYLAEVGREGLIVDVRYNAGGNVSELILEKLARRRLGYAVQRWGEPLTYPYDSVLGPMVALANEYSASDGDIFSHAFKMLELGPLIGKRTWGGVIGISPRADLADGGYTTQPEYSHWFEDVGWRIENYGTDPDIEVEMRPQDYLAGEDTQLNRAITEIQRLLAEKPPQRPNFDNRPNLAPPALPDA